MLVLVLLLLIVAQTACQQQAAFAGPPGWRMVDRFYGFRYEVKGDALQSSDFMTAVAKHAEELGCFGWIQLSPSGSMVGEARCNVNRGPLLETFLSEGVPEAKVQGAEVKVYKDTKIRLHFSTFKVLPADRDTCFLDTPHQCASHTGDGDAGSEEL